jgi:P4 family phage/plasmid primase-like protien
MTEQPDLRDQLQKQNTEKFFKEHLENKLPDSCGYFCPSCDAWITNDCNPRIDDAGTKWYKCPDCGKETATPKVKRLVLKDENEETERTIAFFDFEGKFVPKLLADYIMEKHVFITMMDNEETYAYLDGFYQPLGDVLIKKAVKEALGEDYRKNRALEVLDFIKVSTYTKRREEQPHLIPLENGILDVSKEPFELKKHSPEYMFFNKLPVKYDPEADCPAIKKFMREITNSEEDITLLEEVIGFCLYREYFVAKALMLVGDGSNGKSTFLNMVKKFLGTVNVSGRSLQDLELHRFAKADLHTKLANIYADLPDKALQSTGTFKMLTGRDLIAAEKKFQRTFHFENYAKLMFSANKVPEAYDDTSAFFRRWLIVVFPKAFIGSEADPYILDKLTTETELSGLLNLVLKGLKKLRETGQFSTSKTTEEIKEDYIRKSSPIAAFVLDCLETDSDAFIEKKALYAVFAEYCRGLRLPTVTQDTFFKNLPKHAAISEYRPTIKKQRFTAFKGMRYRVGVSTLSTLSRVFYILSSLKGNYQNHGYRLIEDYGDYIKIEIALDTPDSTSHKLVRTCGDCELFHKPSCVIPVMNFDKVPENATFALDCRSFTPKKEASS